MHFRHEMHRCGEHARHHLHAARHGERHEGFGRHGGRGMRGRGGFGGRRRMFDGNELRLVLLSLIADEPRHGYDLIRAIEERTGGAYAPSPGVVYPTLTLLADMALIEEQATDAPRKVFAATDEGRAHLQAHAEEVTAILARLDALGESERGAEVVPLKRAMRNLHAVIENRLRDGTLERDKAHEAVALIDDVARRIEQL